MRKEIILLSILQYMRQSTTHRLNASHPLDPGIRQSNANLHEFQRTVFVIRNDEIPTVVTPCFLNRRIKPNTRLFP